MRWKRCGIQKTDDLLLYEGVDLCFYISCSNSGLEDRGRFRRKADAGRPRSSPVASGWYAPKPAAQLLGLSVL